MAGAAPSLSADDLAWPGCVVTLGRVRVRVSEFSSVMDRLGARVIGSGSGDQGYRERVVTVG